MQNPDLPQDNYLTMRQWGIIISLLLLMFGTRILWIENTTALEHIDSDDFYTIAHNIIYGNGFSVDKFAPYCFENVRTPAYPYFLAIIFTIFGSNLKLVFLVQSLLDIIVAGCIFRLASGLWLSHRFLAGIIAQICYTFSLTQWRYANELLAEGLLIPLLMLSVYFLWLTATSKQYRHGIAASVFLSLAVLCKPNVQFVPFTFVLAFLLMWQLQWTERLKYIVVFLIGFAIIQAPWYLRNQIIFGEFFLSRTYDDNIARVSAVATLAEIQGESVQPWSSRWEELHGTLVEQAAVKFNWSGQTVPSCMERDQHRQDVATVAIDVIRSHPIAFVSGHVKPVIRGLLPQEHLYWYEFITGKSAEAESTPARDFKDRLLSRPPLLLVMWFFWLVSYMVMYCGMLVGLWYIFRYHTYLLIVIVTLLLVGFFLPGPLVYSRFRAPIVPYVVILYTIGSLVIANSLRLFGIKSDIEQSL